MVGRELARAPQAVVPAHGDVDHITAFGPALVELDGRLALGFDDQNSPCTPGGAERLTVASEFRTAPAGGGQKKPARDQPHRPPNRPTYDEPACADTPSDLREKLLVGKLRRAGREDRAAEASVFAGNLDRPAGAVELVVHQAPPPDQAEIIVPRLGVRVHLRGIVAMTLFRESRPTRVSRQVGIARHEEQAVASPRDHAGMAKRCAGASRAKAPRTRFRSVFIFGLGLRRTGPEGAGPWQLR